MPNLNSWLCCAGLVCLCFFGCRREADPGTASVRELVMVYRSTTNEIESNVDAQVSRLATTERAVVLVQIEWSLTPEACFESLAEFQLKWKSKHPNRNVSIEVLDATPVSDDYRSLAKFEGWKDLEEARKVSPIHGNAELVWLLNGKVQDVQPFTGLTVDEVVAKTEELLYAK